MVLGPVVAGITAVVAESVLARRPNLVRTLRGPVHARVDIDAPVEDVWEVMIDLPGQVAWMPEMKRVRVVTPGPIRVGTVAEADVRILGIGVRDRVVITRFEPQIAYGIEHTALFRGTGELRLRPGSEDGTTIVEWGEALVPPLLPNVGWLVGRSIIGRLYQRDLCLLRDIVERAAATHSTA